MQKTDLYFIKKAIAEAKKCLKTGDVPVGCVLVCNGKIISRGHNRREASGDATAHAELAAIKKASVARNNWYLTDCDLYVTLEPCAMCAGAIALARINRVIFGAYDKKGGCCGSLYSLPQDGKLNHCPTVTGGVMEKECAEMLSAFFKEKREKK